MSTETNPVPELFIDKLSFTLPPVMRPILPKQVEDALEGSQKRYLVKVPFLHRDRYHQSAAIELNGSLFCRFQFNPLNKTNAPLRFDLEPTKTNSEGIRILRRFLFEILGTDYPITMQSARITRIDLAVDILNEKVENLTFHDQNKRKSARYFGSDGKLETAYLGAKSSESLIRIYDKVRQLAEVKGMKMSEMPAQDIVRIEAQLRPRHVTPVKLTKLPNPFAGVSICSLPDPDEVGGTVKFRFFLDSLRVRGMHAALLLIDDAVLREKYLRRLYTNHSPIWWKPAAIWKQLPSAIDRLELFGDPDTVEVGNDSSDESDEEEAKWHGSLWTPETAGR